MPAIIIPLRAVSRSALVQTNLSIFSDLTFTVITTSHCCDNLIIRTLDYEPSFWWYCHCMTQ